MLFLLLIGAASYGLPATATLGTSSAFPGDNVQIPLNVTNFNSIGSITFFISYDSTKLSYINTTDINSLVPGLMVNATGTSINIVWTKSSPYPSVSGLLLNLNFKYKGMSETPLNFLGSCEVITMPGFVPLSVAYTNGAVSLSSGNGTQPTVVLVGGPAATGDFVPVQIQFAPSGPQFTNDIGALTQKIHYDPTKLTFVNVTSNLGSSFSSVPPTYWAANGVVTIAWTCNPGSKPTGLPINYPANQLVVNFIYTSTSSASLEFYSGCEITKIDGSNVQAIYQFPTSVYHNGTYAGNASFGTPSIPVQQGSEFQLPLNLTGFTAPNLTAAFTLNIPFDNGKLTYIGLVSTPAGVTVNLTGSTIQIVYVNTYVPPINGEFLKFRFIYNGVGTANVGFGPGCLFNKLDGTTIQTKYTSTTITPLASGVNAYIGDRKQGAYPDIVDVPVYFTGLSSTMMGAATLYIGYDRNQMDYIGIENNLPGTVANLSGSQIIIAWNGTSATNIDSTTLYPFLNLKFQLKAGVSHCTACNVTFKDGCELSNWSHSIVPANWNNGGVNIKFKLSGTLTYDIPSSDALDGVTIYVKDGAEPVPPAVGPIPTTLYSATTNAAGYFEIYVPNGSYYLYAATTKIWLGPDGADVTQIRRYIAGSLSSVNSPIRLLSADVTQDGSIDGADVIALRRQIAHNTPNPNYKAPDWIFQNPSVVVSCGDLPNKNFTGLLSGDVDGSYNH